MLQLRKGDSWLHSPTSHTARFQLTDGNTPIQLHDSRHHSLQLHTACSGLGSAVVAQGGSCSAVVSPGRSCSAVVVQGRSCSVDEHPLGGRGRKLAPEGAELIADVGPVAEAAVAADGAAAHLPAHPAAAPASTAAQALTPLPRLLLTAQAEGTAWQRGVFLAGAHR